MTFGAALRESGVPPSRSRSFAFAIALAAFAAACDAGAAPPVALAATPAALAEATQGRRVILFGETHDNGEQHRLRLDALRLLLAGGARPAFAFEQFDRERQADIDRARAERPRDADYLIAEARGGNDWPWALYRPLVQLALDYDLPVVAANLSRRDAGKVASEGWPAVFDAATRGELGLDALPTPFRLTHEEAIATGHCGLLPASALPAMARAQIARDIVLARALRPYAARGVVLIAGLGHARNDVGVPHWLTADERRSTLAIGMLEREDDNATPALAGAFDVYVVTPRAERADPCKDLDKRLPAVKRGPG